MIVIDDDSPEPEHTSPLPKTRKPNASRVDNFGPKPVKTSVIESRDTTAAGGQLSSQPNLSVMQKWIITNAWRNNKTLPEIATTVNISDDVLHKYIYGLLRKDATQGNV